MNPAILAAIAASNAEASETIIQRLRKKGATSAASAITIDDADDATQKQLDEALVRGLVMKRAGGQYYVSERAVADRNEGLGYGVVLALLIIGSIVASGFALAMFVAR